MYVQYKQHVNNLQTNYQVLDQLYTGKLDEGTNHLLTYTWVPPKTMVPLSKLVKIQMGDSM